MRTRQAERRSPALAGSALLHGGVLLAAWLGLRHAVPPLAPVPPAVAVTAVSSAPPGLPTPAARSPKPAPAQAPAPAEAAAAPAEEERPTPPAPSPPPAPAPARPRPAPHRPTPPPPPPKPEPPKPRPEPKPEPEPEPKPSPKPAPPKPAPPKPTPKAAAKPRPDLNLDALASSLPSHAKSKDLDLSALASSLPNAKASAHAGRGSLDLAALTDSLPAGSRHAGGSRGAARPETAAQARATAGTTAASADGAQLGALQAKLVRSWRLNCDVAGASSVVVRLQLHLAADGSLAGAPTVIGASGSASADVTRVAQDRAVQAAQLAAPFPGLSAGTLAAVNSRPLRFNARQACGG